jgi:hypothetical protein
MASRSLAARLDRLEAAVRAQVATPITVKRVILEDGDELPVEAGNELLIVRRIVEPPERPAEERVVVEPRPIVEVKPAKARPPDADPFKRPMQYPRLGHI